MSKNLPQGEFFLIPSGRHGRRPLEAQGGVSTSAEVDLRNFFKKKFLKNFQKTFPLLLSLI